MHDREKTKLEHWSYLFDYVFLINLDKRRERLARATAELQNYGIKFIRVAAVEDLDNGARGLYFTYRKLLDMIPAGRSALFFEDDIKFLMDPAPVMEACTKQLLGKRSPWHIFYLGVNTHANFDHFCAANILPVTPEVDGRSTHAIGFSASGMDYLRDALKLGGENMPVDMAIVKYIQTHGYCFCSYPMLCTQYGDYSDIDKKYDDMSYIEQRFNDHVKHLL